VRGKSSMGSRHVTALLCALCLSQWNMRAFDDVRIGAGKQPQVAVDPAGAAVYIVYGSGKDIECATSADGGKTYAAPVNVGTQPNLSLGMRRGPRIAATASSVVITAIGGEKGGGKDEDVFAFRSTDNGKTWTKLAKPINTVAGSAREGLHGMAAGPNNALFCVWIDLRNNKGEIWGAASTDGGATWGADHQIYKSPSGTVCECCHPSVTFDPKGAIWVMFRNSLTGARDMFAARSTDGGKTFTAAAKLGTGTWKLNACPMDGGSITAGADGTATTAWRRDRNVYLAVAGQPERDLGVGEQPAAATGPGGVHLTWNAKRGGDVMALTQGATTPLKVGQGSDPAIAGSLNGMGPVVVTWESDIIRAALVSPVKK